MMLSLFSCSMSRKAAASDSLYQMQRTGWSTAKIIRAGYHDKNVIAAMRKVP